jgi:hypothetical protein
VRFADFLKDQNTIKPQGFIQKPVVSVIMPTYCRAHDGLLARAIKSVLCQTFGDFEFIIVDDGSTDGSQDIIRDFQKQDSRILYVRHEHNSGLPAVRSDEGILLSRGEYLAFEFDDDEWLPRFLEVVVGEARRLGKSFVHCQVEWFVEGKLHHPSFPTVQPCYASLLQGNKIGNVSALLHRRTLEKYGFYNPHVVMRRLSDWDLWLRISEHEPPHLVPHVLARGHGGFPDSINCRAPLPECEDFHLMAQLSSPEELTPGQLLDFDVVSLERYRDRLPPEAIAGFYQDIILPWLEEHKGALAEQGIPVPEIPIPHLETKADYSSSTTPGEPWRKEWRLLMPKWLQPVTQTVGALACRLLCWLSSRAPLLPTRRSPDLRTVDFLCYPLSVRQEHLCFLGLTVEIAGSAAHALFGIEILPSTVDKILAHVELPIICFANRENSGRIDASFYLEPPLPPGEYWALFFARNLPSPAYVIDRGGLPSTVFRIPRWRLALK